MAKESLASNSSDNAHLYFIFTFQVFAMFGICFNFLYKMANAERRASANPKHTLINVIVILFMTKWMVDVYDLTQEDVANNMTTNFDPYRLLHI